MSSNPPSIEDKVSFQNKFMLGLGFMAIFFTNQGVGILAIPYYQMTLGIDPFYLSIAMKIPVLFVIFLVPFVGQYSDNFHSKIGRRRPFLLIFPWLSCFIYGAIWMVPVDWSSEKQLMFFTFLTLLFYIVNTLWTVPLKCLVLEASNDYNERTRVLGFVNYFLKFGSLIYHWLFPLAKLSIFGGVVIGVQYVGWGIALICFGICAMLPGLFVKERTFTPSPQQEKTPLFKSMKSAIAKPNMRLLLMMIICQIFFGHLTGSMDYYVIVYHMNAGDVATGAAWKGYLSTSYAVAAFICMPILLRLSSKLGKVKAMQWVYLLTIVGGFAKWFIFEPGNNWLLIVDAVLGTSIWVAIGVIVTSMIGDQIDVDQAENNVRREGIFVSIQNTIIQVSIALSAILSGLLLNLIGFDALLTDMQTQFSLQAMKFCMVFSTVIAAFAGYFLVRKYDFSESDHQKIKQKITLL